jgi:hypothetical protein
MMTHLRTLVCAGALLSAGSLRAQNRLPVCPHGEADQQGINMTVTLPAHPTRVAATVDSVLQAEGYTVRRSPAALGRWMVEPRFTWLQGVESQGAWHGDEHPGVEVAVSTEARGDSTRLVAGARALCNVPPVASDSGSVGQLVEMISATKLAADVSRAMDTLRANGVDLTTPVPRTQSVLPSVTAPMEVAGFRLASRHDYDHPRQGSRLQYLRDDGFFVNVFVYPGVEVDDSCDAACAVNTEVEGFIRDFPALVRAGHYEELEVMGGEALQPGAGDSWGYGRYLALRVKHEGRTLESPYWVYSFPHFFLKVRASYPSSPAKLRDVQAFVAEMRVKLMPSPR